MGRSGGGRCRSNKSGGGPGTGGFGVVQEDPYEWGPGDPGDAEDGRDPQPRSRWTDGSGSSVVSKGTTTGWLCCAEQLQILTRLLAHHHAGVQVQYRVRSPLLIWLREIASNMVQLQRALNELSEEHNSAMAQSQEKQQQLEKELHAALQDKKCSEEKIEILQGKISMLEDQLAKLEECSAQEKGEVMGDILKLEELKQEVSSLTAKGVRLEEEKQQLDSLVSSLQNSLSESHRAQERLK
ncbi:hypothetical protein DUI87_11184 [Hirundo rustica rustica]|uniref:Uncharacterized protein n=1 Tax=Hirundo rustica rustica TaxID=333673 RepID=A0A3M0KHH1_HIRRU|nr:hypothetical protein DUI87_11184 [Hirundo rustica rustica]